MSHLLLAGTFFLFLPVSQMVVQTTCINILHNISADTTTIFTSSKTQVGISSMNSCDFILEVCALLVFYYHHYYQDSSGTGGQTRVTNEKQPISVFKFSGCRNMRDVDPTHILLSPIDCCIQVRWSRCDILTVNTSLSSPFPVLHSASEYRCSNDSKQ